MKWVPLVLALAVLVGCGSATTPRPAAIGTPGGVPPGGSGPNIVYVLTDDLSSDLLRYMPNVRALRRDGLSFDRYIVSNSLCCPSRATIFTGKYPHNTGVLTNVRPDGGIQAFHKNGNGAQVFAATLRRQGYRTGFYGKYLNGYSAEAGGVPRGWTDWGGSDNGYSGFNYALNQDGTPVRYGGNDSDYATDVLAGQAQRFVADAAQDATPFFLEVSTFAPHFPAVAAPRDQGRFPDDRAPRTPSFNVANRNAPDWLDGRRKLNAGRLAFIDGRHRDRARSVLAVDRMIGALRAQLRALGIEDDTYVIFNSDNGYHMGQHRLAPGKLTAFDSDIRVPLIVAGPDVAPGSTTDALAQNTDLAPTFEAIAGAPPSPWIDGRSLLDLFEGDTPEDWRTAALIEHTFVDGSSNDDPDRQSTLSGNPPDYVALRLRDETYVEYDTGEREYYDLRTDPFERDNAYNRLGPARQAELHAELSRLRDCVGPSSCSTAR